jgi:hypothetical protein
MALQKPQSTRVHTSKPAVVLGDKPRRTDPSDNKMRGYRYVWEVYPDNWNAKWGEKPLLGYVRADSEFNAKYAAYDKKLLSVNFTFGPEIKKATKFIKDI